MNIKGEGREIEKELRHGEGIFLTVILDSRALRETFVKQEGWLSIALTQY